MVDRGASVEAVSPPGPEATARPGLSSTFIIDTLRRHRPLLDGYAVARLALFGSHVAGIQEADSAIDLYVEFDVPTYANYLGLAEALGICSGAGCTS